MASSEKGTATHLSSSVLTTKFYTPSIRPNLVARPRLIERMNIAEHVKLTLVSAPAGYGKSTLAGEWVNQKGIPAAWLTLDKNDNNLNRLITYIIAAIRTVFPDFGEMTLAALQMDQPLAPNTILTSLINEINRTSNQLMLVLDDYHNITDHQVHEAISYLLDFLSEFVHLVILTRSDPPIPLGRLRAQGQLVEIRVNDLSFTSEETTAFLNETMGLGLSSELIRSLEERTEGWITGLQLAALSLKELDSQQIGEFITKFTGGHHYIVDYLLEEVLARQPDSLRDFLLRTSVLERLTGDLCNALTGRADGQDMLESLDRGNLFLLPLDDMRRWYRYHRLFADLLQQRLRQEQGYSARNLHRQASDWFEKNRFIFEAMQHALKAKDFERVAEQMEQVGWELFTRGEMAAIIRWISALPKEILSSRPELSVLYAWAMAKSGQLDDVEPCLQGVDTQTMKGEVAAVRAYVSGVHGNLSQAVELAQTALANLPEENFHMRAIVTQNLGVAYHWIGDPISAIQTLTKAVELTRLANQKFQTLTTLAILGRAHEMQGNLHKAREIYQNAITLGSEASQEPVPFAGMAYVGMARLQYEWNDLEGAMYNAREGIRLSKTGGFMAYQIFGYAILARIYEAKGDHDRADEMLQKAEWLGQGSEYDLVLALVSEMRIRMWIRQGNLSAAEDWARAHLLSSVDELNAASEIEQIAVARVLVAQDRFDQALNLLTQLLDTAQAANRMENVLKILILLALVYQSERKTASALSVLERVLALAKSEGYRRIFIDQGEAMERLLRRAGTQGIEPQFVAKLLPEFDQSSAGPGMITQPLIEPLSRRQLEVLNLLADGLSNEEIAEKLVITVGTVKAHTANIYRKLNVNSRLQAVARARELEIL